MVLVYVDSHNNKSIIIMMQNFIELNAVILLVCKGSPAADLLRKHGGKTGEELKAEGK